MGSQWVKASLLAIFALSLGWAAGASAQQKLYLFNWTQYMKPEIIKQFEKKYDVKVVQNYYSSNAELIAKLKAGGDSQYDVVVPSNYEIQKMAHQGLLHKLDHDKIPNLKNLLTKFKNPPYDPDNEYTAAYQWGTTGLAYDADKLKNVPDSWSVLFDPKVNADYPFALILGDGRVAMEAACAYLGMKFPCMGKDEWTKAAKLLIKTKQRKNMVGFVDGTPALRQLSRGVVAAAIVYNGDFAQDAANDPKTFKHIKYVIPKEGGEIWVDNMAIPAHAPHPGLAMKFINFILSPKIGAELSNFNQYATPNKASRQYLDKALQSPVITPGADVLKRLYFTPPLGGKDLKVFNQIWTAVRSQ